LEVGQFQIGQTSTLYVRINNGRQLQQFTADNIVIAMPQTVTNLAPFLPDLTELAAFFDVETREYFALEFDVAGPVTDAGFTIVNVDVTQLYTLPTPPTFLDFQRTLPYGPAAGWSSSDDYISQAEMVDVINAQLKNMPPSVLSSASLTRVIQHVFQPFFPVSALKCSPNPYRFVFSFFGCFCFSFCGALACRLVGLFFFDLSADVFFLQHDREFAGLPQHVLRWCDLVVCRICQSLGARISPGECQFLKTKLCAFALCHACACANTLIDGRRKSVIASNLLSIVT
jgi:hypothetical protein